MKKIMRKVLVFVMITIIVSVCTTQFSEINADVAYTPDIGIWYSTWYANQGNYFWKDGFGANSTTQFLADVNGDGKDDACVFYNSDGSWRVATSDGTKFVGDALWVLGHGCGSTKQFLADVNGDGKDDAIVYFSGNGTWYIAASNGNGFNGYTLWKSGFGTGADDAFVGDVNGDGKCDALYFVNNTGNWYAALSNGSSFGTSSQWIAGFGCNATKRFLEDVNGDGKADAACMYTGDGKWWVATSNGSGFNGYTCWISGYGQTSANQLLGDKNDDGKADAISFYTSGTYGPTGADWQARISNGSTFVTETYPYIGEWKYKHGAGSTWQGMGKVFGSTYLGAAPVVFYGSTGKWKVIPADNNYVKPNTWNTWESGLSITEREIKYRPKIGGQYRMYDSGETVVIDEHLGKFANAKIDFMIYDWTNAINADNNYIKNRGISVCNRVKTWNDNSANRDVKYCIAVGKIQFSNDPQKFEDECKQVWDEFVTNTTYGGSNYYYYLSGKPLIVSFCSYSDRLAIQNWTGDKTYQNKFSIKWAQGRVPEDGNPPDGGDYGLYCGWVGSIGSLSNPDCMFVNPGHNPNNGDTIISRVYNGENGGWYRLANWDRVIQQKPAMVVIGSFNEFAEENAVEPADTSLCVSPTEKWYNTSGQLDSDFYWNMTVSKINELLQ